jgi:hypothetical protein
MEEPNMNRRPIRWAALALACLLAAGCQDKRPPVKPTVQQATAARAA